MKTFADHLTVAPPARWQTDDSQLKQASQTAIPLWAAFTASQSASDWDQRKGPADEAVHLYCDPIIHINSDLIAAGLPLSDQLGCTL